MKQKLWRLYAITIAAGLLSGCASDTGRVPAITSPIPDLPAFDSLNQATIPTTYVIQAR